MIAYDIATTLIGRYIAIELAGRHAEGVINHRQVIAQDCYDLGHGNCDLNITLNVGIGILGKHLTQIAIDPSSPGYYKGYLVEYTASNFRKEVRFRVL